MDPDAFNSLLDNVMRKILDESMSLPVRNEELARELQKTPRRFTTAL
jgi:hypothetical protein